MADSLTPPATLITSPKSSDAVNPNPAPDPQPVASITHLQPLPPPHLQPQLSSTLLQPNPNPNPSQNPNFFGYAPSPIPGAVLPLQPSFRPLPPFNHNYQSQAQGVQPPGVNGAGGSFHVAPPPMMQYQIPPNQGLRPYAPMPNGYAPPGSVRPLGGGKSSGSYKDCFLSMGSRHFYQLSASWPCIKVFCSAGDSIHAYGMPRYPSPYPTLGRPTFLPRPPGAIGVLPAVSRPLVPGMRPLGPPVLLRPPVIPAVTPAEKPLTTIYVSKIPITADNEFMLSLLKFCGPVKSWKRPQDLRNGTPKGFGFCEFESAEGVLRALRLLSKFNLDGQELALIVDQATTEYLARYVEKKTENSKKLKENQSGFGDIANEDSEPKEPSKEDAKNDNPEKKESRDMATFGIVTDEDKAADREALDKLKSTTEEWLKTRPPLPPPPPPPLQSAADGNGHSNDLPAKSRDGDSDVDLAKSDTGEDKNGDETTSDIKTTGELDKPESSPDRKRYDRRGRDNRDNRDKFEKEREIDRYEREAERERVRKEREQRRKIEDAERVYEETLKEWEYREKEKERQRSHVKDREKERERKRKKEILYDEEEEDDDSRRRSRRSVLEEKRKRRQREKDDDMADRLLEEEEIVEEAKRRAEEEQQQRDSLIHLPTDVTTGDEKAAWAEQSTTAIHNKPDNQDNQGNSSDHEDDMMMDDDVVMPNGTHEEPAMAPVTESDIQQSCSAQPRKLGFGLAGSGKRSTVPSVFNEEDDDEEGKDKKMRPLVPIDYSTEEIQAVQQTTVSGTTPPNLAAAAEFAKRISNVSSKEEKSDNREREKSGRRSHDRDRSSHRDKDRNDENRTKEESKGKANDRHKDRDHGVDKVKTPDNKKLLDAKQLIDMIPKTKEELFSYEINWAVYDKHELHEKMRPWITKKITEFLGEEEKSLIDYIVSSTREHMNASDMLEQLQSILDEEAELFILKMWRMLIFEIKKVETGLSFR
ncbi:hypothetical protein ACFE04_024813 [Oxalis oulophora]